MTTDTSEKGLERLIVDEMIARGWSVSADTSYDHRWLKIISS